MSSQRGDIRRANFAFITAKGCPVNDLSLSIWGMSSAPGRISHLLGRLMAINYHNDNKSKGVSKKPHSGCGRLQITVVTWPRRQGRAGAMTDRASPTGWWLEQALRLSRLAPAFLASSEADVANRSSTAAGASNTPSGHTAACRIDP